MRLLDYCATCGKRIEVGEPCIGVEKNSEPIGDSICLECAKIKNLPDGKDPVPITDLLARVEVAEERCKRLDEARERANEACAKWEYRAEKAEMERGGAAIQYMRQMFGWCTGCVYFTGIYGVGCKIGAMDTCGEENSKYLFLGERSK